MAQIRSALANSDGAPTAPPSHNTGAHDHDDDVDENSDMGEQTNDAHEQSSSSTSSMNVAGGEGNSQGASNNNNDNGGGDDGDIERLSNDGDGGIWLKNYTPHHTRIGPNYQVTDLPTASCRPVNSNSTAISINVTSCVSPGEGS